ncbi:hypothetical protein pb186bvf_012972 [Paramecium bursaria]
MQENRRQSNNTFSSDEQQLKLLTNESNYLESDKSSEVINKLSKCKTEHILQTAQYHQSSNSFNIFDKKNHKVVIILCQFTFPNSECLEWETIYQSKQEGFQLLNYLKQQCYIGQIIYTHDQIPLLQVETKIPNKIFWELFSKLIDKGWILKTNRLFNDKEISFFSMGIKTITYENLFWVVKSIQRDLITPTERLVVSRVKECFGIKLQKSEWELIIYSLNQIKGPVKFRNSNGKLIELPQMVVKRIRDPLIKEETLGIYIAGQNWNVEDEYINDLDKKQEWFIFDDFLKEFFSIATRDNNRKLLKGGRYGCAQFSILIYQRQVKLLGPKQLHHVSLGRLTLFVQMAVNKGIVKYNKTILMHNQDTLVSDQTLDGSNDGEQQIKSKIKELQQNLIEILLENPEGVSLAQIPQLLKERIGGDLNFAELGFPKLKNFMESVKDIIQIENSVRNNYVARVIQNKIPKKMLQQFEQTKRQQQEISVEKYLVNALRIIKQALSKNKYGISIQTLQNELHQMLGEPFNYSRFQCISFFQFLQNYAENLLVIVCQKEGQYLIYEKDHRFAPPPMSNWPQKPFLEPFNDQQLEQILNDHFPHSLTIHTPRDDNNDESSSWLGRFSDRSMRSPSQIQHGARAEDSHQEINDNLKFIEELLGNETFQNYDYSKDWSIHSSRLGMMSSINNGSQAHSIDFEFNK